MLRRQVAPATTHAGLWALCARDNAADVIGIDANLLGDGRADKRGTQQRPETYAQHAKACCFVGPHVVPS
jgi:hypothetical protein